MLTARISSSGPRPATQARALLIAEAVMGPIAVPCGVLLIINGLGMSENVLDRSPFETFLVPGLLLAVVAGSILLGWIVIEAITISGGRGLQALVFVWALVVIALAWPLVARSPASPSAREHAS